MLFDIGLVIICHFITANLVLLNKHKSSSGAKLVKAGAIVTISIGVLALGDLIFKKILGMTG